MKIILLMVVEIETDANYKQKISKKRASQNLPGTMNCPSCPEVAYWTMVLGVLLAMMVGMLWMVGTPSCPPPSCMAEGSTLKFRLAGNWMAAAECGSLSPLPLLLLVVSAEDKSFKIFR